MDRILGAGLEEIPLPECDWPLLRGALERAGLVLGDVWAVHDLDVYVSRYVFQIRRPDDSPDRWWRMYRLVPDGEQPPPENTGRIDELMAEQAAWELDNYDDGILEVHFGPRWF